MLGKQTAKVHHTWGEALATTDQAADGSQYSVGLCTSCLQQCGLPTEHTRAMIYGVSVFAVALVTAVGVVRLLTLVPGSGCA